MVPEATARPFPLRTRGAVMLALLGAGAWAFLHLDLSVRGLVPHHGGLAVAGEFFARALSPALTSEADYLPAGSPPLLLASLSAAVTTVTYAAAAIGLSLALGVVLGFLGSTAWWASDPLAGRGLLRRTLAPAVYGVTRAVIAFMRSVHEVLWAVLFLAAFGISPLAAVVAITIPYAGTVAKIFSEMVDEAPRGAAKALQGSGATSLQVFWFGLVPRAAPDMLAYAFYRFECALRSSAVLGFFGYETLGREIRLSFEGANYGEVWTHLYVLILIILVFDAWSGALRRRFVA